ncbi:MAG: mycothiol acetyltransferase, partial [Actinomycetota bacterium]
MSLTISALVHLTPELTKEITQLAFAAAAVDEMAPLSEHVLIHLHHGGDEADEHLIATDAAGKILGYLHLDQTDAVAGPVVEVVVHPDFRNQGIGRGLIELAISKSDDSRMRLWAHGELASAYSLAAKLGFAKTRELWQMRRSLFAPLPKLIENPKFTIRPFQVGKDESAWLELNAKVFVDHPEQGRMSPEDLKARMSESWFDPAGFLIATTADSSGLETVVGYHWTKIHGGTGGHGHSEMGEIYVLGIAPDQRGTGLAKLLSIRGL